MGADCNQYGLLAYTNTVACCNRLLTVVGVKYIDSMVGVCKGANVSGLPISYYDPPITAGARRRNLLQAAPQQLFAGNQALQQTATKVCMQKQAVMGSRRFRLSVLLDVSRVMQNVLCLIPKTCHLLLQPTEPL